MLSPVRAATLLIGLLLPAAALAQLPVVELAAGMHRIHAEVAASFPQRQQGLMHRRELGQNDGMVFVFDENERHCMWMKNTLIPLSVAFIDASGSIINIEEMAPQTEDTHCAARPARYALEMSKGWFAKRGIKPGAKLRGLDGLEPQ
ncbi:MAG TPA: DUF192 domain-containing protein [Burkholderiales bacterium]|nr:DUF192 domain-containing protein [Burkholderiales bacterium]